jgi:hypothetical protein
MRWTILLVIFGAGYESNAFAWGYDGHHIAASLAAKRAAVKLKDFQGLTSENAGKTNSSEGWRRFFLDRKYQMGYLSNVPDVFWKNSDQKSRLSVNPELEGPTHFFVPERLLGVPKAGAQGESEYLKQVLSLPFTYSDYFKKLQLARLTVKEVGQSPWRLQELFDQIVLAIKCAGEKSPIKPQGNSVWSQPYPVINLKSVLIPSFQCKKNTGRNEALTAAVVLMGVVSHYLGDLVQPQHVSLDPDGWGTGNGGLHVYFESLIPQAVMDQAFELEIFEISTNRKFEENYLKSVKVDWTKTNAALEFAFRMAAQSRTNLDHLIELDDKVAVIEKGDKLAPGSRVPRANPTNHKLAKRKPPGDDRVQKGFREFITEQLAAGVISISEFWLGAVLAAGNQNIEEINAISLSFPSEIPFIPPRFQGAGGP